MDYGVVFSPEITFKVRNGGHRMQIFHNLIWLFRILMKSL